MYSAHILLSHAIVQPKLSGKNHRVAMKTLDLMNNRSQRISHQRLFDSTEYIDLSRTEQNRLSKGNINFDSQSHRPDMINRNQSQQLDSVDKPYKVKGVLKFKKECSFTPNYFRGNEAAERYYCYKERISSPILNKVLDREHDIPDDGVAKNVELGKVTGGHWSASTSQRKPLCDIPTDLGPGQYDITASEKNLLRTIKFNDMPTGRHSLEYVDEPSATTYSPNHDYTRPRSSRGVVPFSDVPRLDAPEYRQPGYVQTSGMSLSPDFDRKWGWEKPNIPIKLDTTGPRLQPPPVPITTANEPRPDYGNKISISTAAMKTNKKYAMCFESKVPNRLVISPPTSPVLGPGCYPASESPTFTARFPNKTSPSFLSERFIDIELLGDQFRTLQPRHYRGRSIKQHLRHCASATELRALSFTERLPVEKRYIDAHPFQDPVRRMTQGYVSKQRIQKIYPRLYSPPKTKT